MIAMTEVIVTVYLGAVMTAPAESARAEAMLESPV